MFVYYSSKFYSLTLPCWRTNAPYTSSSAYCSYQKDKWTKPGNFPKRNALSEITKKKIHFSCYSRFKNLKLGFPRQCPSDHLFLWHDAVMSRINFSMFLIFCFHREDGGSTFFQNICKFLSAYTASHARSHCHLKWRMSSDQCLVPVTLACDK